MNLTYNGFWQLILVLLPFLFVQRWLHRNLLAVLMILFKRAKVILAIFSLFFFPGIFLHESSHFLAALLLGVRTGRFSILPQIQPGGDLRLGFVEVQKVDFIRNALIGIAPLLTGGLAIALLSRHVLSFPADQIPTSLDGWLTFFRTIRLAISEPLFWIGFYLAFTISSMMLPSESDRSTWMPLLFFFVLLFALMLLFGAGDWLQQNLSPRFDHLLKKVALIFAISLGLHVALLVPLGLSHLLLRKVTR